MSSRENSNSSTGRNPPPRPWSAAGPRPPPTPRRRPYEAPSGPGRAPHGPPDHGVRAALGIAEHVLASKNRVGLIVQREVVGWVPPAFGRMELYGILDHLAHVRPGGEWPFAQLAWVLTRFFPRDCLIVRI